MNYAVILAGGIGMRFWPFSRELEPKQFMQVVGRQTLFQQTIQRLKGIIPQKNIFIITNQRYLYEVRRQIRKFKVPEANVILEPEGKNTAPAIGLAARLLTRKDKNALLLVLPSDHYIKKESNFKRCLKNSMLFANGNYLVTLGIHPDFPSTGYGYIKAKKRLDAGGKSCLAYKVEQFLEKPGLTQAKRYFKDRSFYWNSGMFIFKAGVFLEEAKKHLPGLYSCLSKVEIPKDIPLVWPKIKPISVDYGIMEHSSRIALIPADFSWTDLGSWDALDKVLAKNKKINLLNDDCLDFGSKGLSVFSRSRRFISTIGLKDIIIADTPDALLVCAKNSAEEVKNIVQALRVKKRREHIVHLTERRPWGSFTVLEDALGFKIKLIEILGHKRLSLQRHRHRAEHWVVVSGQAKVKSGSGKVSLVKTNQSIYIPKLMRHRLENPSSRPLKIVEVQTGAYLGEDDIERFSDDFTR